jgi:hypothetical protein
MLAKPNLLTPLIPNPATGRDPEPVPSISHPHKIHPNAA